MCGHHDSNILWAAFPRHWRESLRAACSTSGRDMRPNPFREAILEQMRCTAGIPVSELPLRHLAKFKESEWCFFLNLTSLVICSIFWPLREARCDMQYFLFPIRVEWEGGCDLGHCGGHKFVSWIKTGLLPVVDWVSAKLRSLSLMPHKSTKTERNEVQLWLRYRLQVALIAVPISIFSPMQITCLSPVASLDR